MLSLGVIRTVTSLAIILCMMMHCASRLGVLSFLYEQRLEIAYHIGLLAEIPIAMCNSDYDAGNGLVLGYADPTESAPAAFSAAQEIQLFLSPSPLNLQHHRTIIDTKPPGTATSHYNGQHRPDIFHPPSFRA